MTFMDNFGQRKAELDRVRQNEIEHFQAEELTRFTRQVEAVLPVGVQIVWTGAGDIPKVRLDLGKGIQIDLQYWRTQARASISNPARPDSLLDHTSIHPWPTTKGGFKETLIDACVKLHLTGE